MFKYIIWSEFISMQSILWTSCATLSSLFIRFKTYHFCIFQYSMTLNQIRNIFLLFKWLVTDISIYVFWLYFAIKLKKTHHVYDSSICQSRWIILNGRQSLLAERFSWRWVAFISGFLEHYSFFWFPFPCCFFYLYQLGVYEGICKDTHTGY